MLDQGRCGYNNFEYVSVAKLKEVYIVKEFASFLGAWSINGRGT